MNTEAGARTPETQWEQRKQHGRRYRLRRVCELLQERPQLGSLQCLLSSSAGRRPHVSDHIATTQKPLTLNSLCLGSELLGLPLTSNLTSSPSYNATADANNFLINSTEVQSVIAAAGVGVNSTCAIPKAGYNGSAGNWREYAPCFSHVPPQQQLKHSLQLWPSSVCSRSC